MEEAQAKRGMRKPTLQEIWRLFLFTVGVIAVVQELRKPADERTWEGKVGGLVPYDFRMPTKERFQATYWNPDGPFLGTRVWGVGWAPNFGAVRRLLTSATSE